MNLHSKFIALAEHMTFAVLFTLAAGAALAQEQSADEVAKSLANPNTPLASLNFENGFTWYNGDLPGADRQTSYYLLFQPILPFPLDTQGTTLFWRPAVPFLFNQPVFDATRADFRDATFGIGDIGFDLAIGRTEKNGFLWAFGGLFTLPTATNSDFAGKQFRVGPEMILGQFMKKGVVAVFPSHQWDAGGWSENDYSLTTIQVGGAYFLGGGRTLTSFPKLQYNWETGDWTIPLNLAFSQTVISGGMPIKYALSFDYYIEQPDAFGPDFMFRFTITPVVKNPLGDIFMR